MGDQEESEVVEGVRDHGKVVDGAGYDGKCPRRARNMHVVETNAQRQDNWLGGHLGDREESEGAEDGLVRASVVDSAGHDGIGPTSEGNQRFVEINAQCRENRPGGHSGEQVESGVIKADRKRRNDGIGVVYDGNRRREDGAASSARRESKRLKTKLLAE